MLCVLLVKVIVKEGERGYYKTVFINILMLGKSSWILPKQLK